MPSEDDTHSTLSKSINSEKPLSPTEGKKMERETPSYQNQKFHRTNYLGIPPLSQFSSFNSLCSSFPEEEQEKENRRRKTVMDVDR